MHGDHNNGRGRGHRRAHGPDAQHGWRAAFGPEGPFGAEGPFGPGGPFGGGRHGGGRHGDRGGPFDRRTRGRRRLFDRAGMRLVLLSLIARQPRHGYDLIRAMEELSGGHYSPSPGVVYPALAMLADEGLVAEQASEDQRRSFAINDAGRRVLEDEAEQANEAMERLTSLGERAERHRSPSIERAAANLFMALGQRMSAASDGTGAERDGELPHKIAEILDEAARRIERL